MRGMMLLAGAMLAGVAGSAQAADSGEYGAALRRMISETAAGRCPEDVMATPLLTACREQLPKLGPEIAALGPIETVTFVKAEDRNGKRIETYAVKHAGGKTLTWGIGDHQDGKFSSAYSLGE